ncbi:MAG TPA: cupin domain-containing protein [Candidatus Udaeobacter sp.]|nr:cupin domain-containing protein [Candidatus Udaeobacter sp.]
MLRRSLRPCLALLIAGLWLVPAPLRADDPKESAVPRQLTELAAHFTWTPLERQAPVVQITITGDPGGEWFVTPRSDGDVELSAGKAPNPGFTCELDAVTLGRLYRGELSGMTAAGKGTGDESSPLEILPGSSVKENAQRASLAPVFHFLTHFWNAGDPERIVLGREHARPMSGASLVGLYYHPGFRSAWYAVRGQESLNGEGDSSPYPQAYVILRGRARIVIDRRPVEVPAGESIYVPPGAKHAVRSQDGGEVELLWLAWGEGA